MMTFAEYQAKVGGTARDPDKPLTEYMGIPATSWIEKLERDLYVIALDCNNMGISLEDLAIDSLGAANNEAA